MGDSNDEEYYEEAFDNLSDQDQANKQAKRLTDYELIMDASPKEEEEEILLENKQGIPKKTVPTQNMEEDLEFEESKSDQHYEDRRKNYDPEVIEEVKPSGQKKDRVAKSADRSVILRKNKNAPSKVLAQPSEIKRENVFSDKIKEIVKDTDYQKATEAAIYKENTKLREMLKQLNQELSKIIEQQATKMPVKKEPLPAKRVSSAKLKTMLEEIKNNKKLIANLNEEMDRLTKRVNILSDPTYYEKLVEKINERKKTIEETKKYNKNAVWDNKKQGKNLDQLENVTGPETLKKINELNVELSSTNKKNLKMKDKMEELEKQSDDLGTKLTLIEDKYQKALALAEHYKIFRKDIKNADKYDELNKKLKTFERNKATLDRKLEQMTENYRKGIDDVRRGIKEIESACTEKEIEINKQQYEIKELLGKESINKDLLLKIKFNMATTPRKMQRMQEEQDPSIKSNDTITENQFFKENILDDLGTNVDTKQEEVLKADVLDKNPVKKEEDRQQKKRGSLDKEFSKKSQIDSPEKAEYNGVISKIEEKPVKSSSVKALATEKRKFSEDHREDIKEVKSESRNTPENPIPQEIVKNDQNSQMGNKKGGPEKEKDHGMDQGKNLKEEIEPKKPTTDDSRRDSNELENSQKSVIHSGPSALTKPNFKKKTKQDSGNYAGLVNTQEQSTIESHSNPQKSENEGSSLLFTEQKLIDPNIQPENRLWNQNQSNEPKLFNFKKKKENNNSFTKDPVYTETKEDNKAFNLNEEMSVAERKPTDESRNSRDDKSILRGNEKNENKWKEEHGSRIDDEKKITEPVEEKKDEEIAVYTNTNSRRTNARTFKKEDDTSSYAFGNKPDPMKKIMDPFAKFEDINNIDFSKKERKVNLFAKEEAKGAEFDIPTIAENKKIPNETRSQNDIFDIPEIKSKEEPPQQQKNKFSRAFVGPDIEEEPKKFIELKNEDYQTEKKPERVIESNIGGMDRKPGRFKMNDNEQKINKEKQKNEKQRELAEKAEKQSNDLFEELDF